MSWSSWVGLTGPSFGRAPLRAGLAQHRPQRHRKRLTSAQHTCRIEQTFWGEIKKRVPPKLGRFSLRIHHPARPYVRAFTQLPRGLEHRVFGKMPSSQLGPVTAPSTPIAISTSVHVAGECDVDPNQFLEEQREL